MGEQGSLKGAGHREKILSVIGLCTKYAVIKKPAVPHCNVDPQVSLYRRFTDTKVYGTGSVKIWKTRHAQNIRGYLDSFFYSV